MNRKFYLLATVFTLVGLIVNAQPTFLWAKGIGGLATDSSMAITADAAGNTYVTGSFSGSVDFDPGPGTYSLTSTGGTDIFICKLDATGAFVWAKSMGGTGYDYGRGITVDASGNIYYTGAFESTVDFDPGSGTYTLTSAGYYDVIVSKINNSGSFLWAKRMGGAIGNDYGFSIVIDASGNVYTTGYFSGTADFDPGAGVYNLTSAGVYDIFISKLDPSGAFVWAKGMGSSSYDIGYSISLDASGDVFTTGAFSNTTDFDPGAGTYNLTSAGAGDIFVSKLDAFGTFVWAKSIGGAGDDGGTSIVLDASGNVYTTGRFAGAVDFDPGPGSFSLSSTSITDYDVFISKLNASGTFVWARAMGGTGSDKGQAIAVDAGNVFTTGGFEGTADFDPGASVSNLISVGFGDIFLSKLDAGGNYVWAKSMGSSNYNDFGYALALDPSGDIYTTGRFEGVADFNPDTPAVYNLTSAGLADIFVQKMGQCVAPTPDICQVTVDSLGNNNEIYWEKTLYPSADSFIVYREVSTNVYSRIAALHKSSFSMYSDTNRSIGPANGDPNLTYYKYKLQLRDSCGNYSALSKWHETILIQDQMNGNFNWNMYAIESATSTLVSIYNLKRRMVSTGTETIITSTTGGLASDPLYNSFWSLNVKWFVDAVGFNCNATARYNPNQVLVLKTKTKSNQSNDKLALGISSNQFFNFISVYPNPAGEVLHLDLNALPKEETSIDILNALGQVVYHTTSWNQYLVINTQTLQNGVYFVSVKQSNKAVVVKKVVIEK